MQFIGIIKRVIPFFLTFAAGLFIASFFVSLSAPRFGGIRKNRSERHGKHCEFKSELEQLRLENSLLKSELESMRFDPKEMGSGSGGRLAFDLDVPPPPPSAPAKEMKMKTVTVK
jgi:hypothetical protein